VHIFFNDTPLILVKPGKVIDPDNYQVKLTAGDAIMPEKLINHVLITDVSAIQVEDVIKFLSDNVFHHVTSITLDVKNYQNAKNFIKSFFKIEKAAGGIVRKGSKVLMIYRLKKWDLPKGKCEKGEKMKQCALREVQEECNITVKSPVKICNSWHTYSLNGKNILKKTSWYIMQCVDDSKMTPQIEEDIEDLRWLKTRDLFHALKDSYQSIRWVFDKYLRAEINKKSK
jgi:8-oxo-(d)GTP phosphatase